MFNKGQVSTYLLIKCLLTLFLKVGGEHLTLNFRSAVKVFHVRAIAIDEFNDRRVSLKRGMKNRLELRVLAR